LSSINKKGHLYQTLKEGGEAVLNFPSAEVYPLCYKTVGNNGFDDDEIALSGLTAEPASLVHAPRIKECFLDLECCFRWERDIAEGASHAVVCLEVLNLCMDEAHLDENALGRCGESGYVYNLHYPVNPEGFGGKSRDYLAVLQKLEESEEY
jgi:flavin reductase (DIM6/NTAB) family NADH-FMN oxidoreductase RutF